MSIPKNKLAVIHIIKKELSLSDAHYRDILRRVAGVRSAKDLDEKGFTQLMKFLVRSPYYRQNPQGLTIRQKLFIRHLARDIGWTEEHLNNFLLKYYHKAKVDLLNRKEAVKVIESLKQISRHRSEGREA